MTPPATPPATVPAGVCRVDTGRSTLTLRRRGVALRVDVRPVVVCAVLAVATLCTSVLALMTGSFALTVGEVGSALTGGAHGIVREIVVEWRLPRVVAAVVFGAALGVSGAVFQSLTRNPLASPDVIGFSTGSYTGVLVVTLLFGGSYLALAGGALLGGIATAAVVYVLAHRRGAQGFRLIVVGIAMSAVLGSLNTWLVLRADLDSAMAAAMWAAGSLNATTWPQVVAGSIAVVALLAVCAPLCLPMRQLELGDETAEVQGVAVERTRLVLVLVGVALTASVTAAAGPILFVALAAPQIGRRLARTAGITTAPAACTGALLLIAADFVAQHVLPAQVPVGLVTVVIGGAYLLWLLLAEARRRL